MDEKDEKKMKKAKKTILIVIVGILVLYTIVMVVNLPDRTIEINGVEFNIPPGYILADDLGSENQYFFQKSDQSKIFYESNSAYSIKVSKYTSIEDITVRTIYTDPNRAPENITIKGYKACKYSGKEYYIEINNKVFSIFIMPDVNIDIEDLII